LTLHNGKVRASMGAIFPRAGGDRRDRSPHCPRASNVSPAWILRRIIAVPAFREFDCYLFGKRSPRLACRGEGHGACVHDPGNPGHRIG
jgi:hypothetical protein